MPVAVSATDAAAGLWRGGPSQALYPVAGVVASVIDGERIVFAPYGPPPPRRAEPREPFRFVRDV
jgi:hypothetical protein